MDAKRSANVAREGEGECRGRGGGVTADPHLPLHAQPVQDKPAACLQRHAVPKELAPEQAVEAQHPLLRERG